MHPTIQHDQIQARIADLQRQAKRHRLAPQARQARQATQARRHPQRHGNHPAPAHRAIILMRRALAAVSIRSL